MGTRPHRLRVRRRQQIVWSIAALAAVLVLSVGLWVWWVFAGAAPILEGRLALPGLSAAVDIVRDAAGVPTISAQNRPDLARALGFLHGQERFFEMDLLRRVGAGELSELVGDAALTVDMAHRLHRFRARAETLLARMPGQQRQLLEAYAAGVNAGLGALSRRPFEYTLLREMPVAWRPADTLLAVYAMYFDLQDSTPWPQQRTAAAYAALGPALADFLYPHGTPSDAALDGSMLPEPALPDAPPSPAVSVPAEPPPMQKGSNAFAVSGKLTGTGAAIVANDMHLGLGVPNIWYRARMRLAPAGQPIADLDGVTLPGTPLLVTGSNGKIAWGFTDAYVATGDAVLLDPAPGDPLGYLTPDGPKKLIVTVEQVCSAHTACRDLPVEESVWGPVVSRDPDGRRVVWRWAAQDANAIDLDGLLALETAGTVREALDAAHRSGLPHENFVVGDHDGHIGWTIIGHIPKRIGLDDAQPHSWADGTRGWQGYLSAEQVPEIIDPPDGVIWSANNRAVGGDSLRLVGDGGYADGGRAREIRDDLHATSHFAEADLLAIQLDARAPMLAPWQALLAKLLAARSIDPRFAAMLDAVRNWGGAAVVDSVGYRLVRSFQEDAVRIIYGGFGGLLRVAADSGPVAGQQSDWPSLRLLTEQPPHLVPPPYRGWAAVTDALLSKLSGRIDSAASGDVSKFTWGARNHAAIHHTLAAAVPLLGRLTDPPDEAVAGDTLEPRVVTPGNGASERFDVSPGNEGDGIFEMPVGEASNPTAPYYLAGHRDWVEGRPSSFLPGPPRWTLVLEPV